MYKSGILRVEIFETNRTRNELNQFMGQSDYTCAAHIVKRLFICTNEKAFIPFMNGGALTERK